MALVTPKLQLIWANGWATSMFAEATHLTLRDGVLTTTEQSQAQAMKAFFKKTTDARSLWICRAGELSIIVCSQAVRLRGGMSAIAVTVFPTQPTNRYLWADFGEPFGLTPAEVKVVKRMVEGANADDIAEQQSVSVETVRTHIRRTYGKLGIKGREQLFALIAPYRIG